MLSANACQQRDPAPEHAFMNDGGDPRNLLTSSGEAHEFNKKKGGKIDGKEGRGQGKESTITKNDFGWVRKGRGKKGGNGREAWSGSEMRRGKKRTSGKYQMRRKKIPCML